MHTQSAQIIQNKQQQSPFPRASNFMVQKFEWCHMWLASSWLSQASTTVIVVLPSFSGILPILSTR